MANAVSSADMPPAQIATSHPEVAVGTPEEDEKVEGGEAGELGVLGLMGRVVLAGRKAGGSGGECTSSVCARHHASNRPQAKGAYLKRCESIEVNTEIESRT